MNSLEHYAALAEIFGATTIVIGAVFAFFQFREHRKRTTLEITAELCRKFAEPELAKAINLLRKLPDDISYEDMHQLDNEYEAAAQIVAMSYETMGLLVHKGVASFELTTELSGGLLLMVWRKIRGWIRGTREYEGNPRFAEWVEWLAIKVEKNEASMVPAYLSTSKLR